MDVKAFELNPDAEMQSFGIYQQVHSFPTFTLNIRANKQEEVKRLTKISEFEITGKANDVKLRTKLAVVTVKKIDQDIIQYEGYCCGWEDYSTLKTKYLGNTGKQIIGAVACGKKVNFLGSPSYDAWQINETNLHALLRLCDCISEYPYWSITQSTINLSEKSMVNDFVPFSEDDFTFFSKREIKPKGGVGYGYTIGGLNYQKNLTTRTALRPVIFVTGKYSGDYPYLPGDRMKNNYIDYKCSFLEVHTVNTVYTQLSCVSEIGLAGL